MSCRLLAALLATAIFASPAMAQEEKGLFGLGLIIGEPTGISAKYYLSDDTAIDAAVGGAPVQGGWQVHGDYLWHPWTLESQDSFVLPAYIGPGMRLLFDNRDRGEADVTHVGVRGVVGALFDFRKVPLDVFLEVAGVVEWKFSENDDSAGFGFAINAGAGVRYYF